MGDKRRGTQVIRQRVNYWSCSRFADVVRGEKKPLALGLEEWEVWRKDARSKRPIRYFLAEEVLNCVQNMVNFPRDLWNSFRNYWNNRFVFKTHCLKTGLPPGRFHELDDRMLHGLFNELVEFVEYDLAHAHAWGDNKDKYEFKRGRCAEAGVDHLEWASGLKFGKEEGFKKGDPGWGKPTPQAKAALVIKELYKWWKEDRPSRLDPMEVSGWSSACEGEASEKSKKAAFKRLSDLEESYEKEDERMLVKLIKIRKSLWT